MTVKQAREAARQWVIEAAESMPGFRGAYTAGSTNWPQGPRGSLTPRFEDNYRALAEDLGLLELAAVRRRCGEIERALPEVCAVAERIIAANRDIE